jgi:hypothetical protein
VTPKHQFRLLRGRRDLRRQRLGFVLASVRDALADMVRRGQPAGQKREDEQEDQNLDAGRHMGFLETRKQTLARLIGPDASRNCRQQLHRDRIDSGIVSALVTNLALDIDGGLHHIERLLG